MSEDPPNTATLEITEVRARSPDPVPALLLVFSAGEALLAPIPMGGGTVELGRGAVRGIRIEDATMSRRHASVARGDKGWRLRDLGSRNGVIVDGQAVVDAEIAGPRVMRLGESIFLFCDDARRFLDAAVERGARVMGPTLARVWEQIAAAARGGETLHVTGESGSGKELAARAFHAAGPRAAGPFVAVNCAAIPEGVAERLLFGARKGAFSGAHENAEGYVQAASGGTLFLDEVGELDLGVQAKLLRVLETREVLALGDAKPRRVELGLVSATHLELRAQVAERRFREDLYFRIGRPHVVIPPVRERLEEIPFFIERELAAVDRKLRADASFVELCLSRPWPGNVRELIAEVREAARAALAADATVVDARRLAAKAGASFAVAEPAPRPPQGALPPRDVIEAALRREGGKIATAARALGIHRNQLRRWLAKNHIDPRAPGGSEDSE